MHNCMISGLNGVLMLLLLGAMSVVFWMPRGVRPNVKRCPVIFMGCLRMIIVVDTVRGFIMGTSNRNFSKVEYEGDQVVYCLRIRPLASEHSMFPIYSEEYTASNYVKELQAIAKIINDGHSFKADVMCRKIGIYTCQEFKGGWERYGE